MPISPMPMPGAPPGGGAPPPGGPPGGTGAATAPGPMPGAAQQGITAVKVGLEALQKALPALPMGSPLHTSVLKAVADIAKNIEAGGGGEADKIQQLMAMARSAHAQPNPLAAMMPGGAPPGAGGGASPPALGGGP